MLRLLEKKYSMQFVMLSDLREDSSSGVRYVRGTVAPATDPAAEAKGWVDTQGNFGDDYSARVFKDQTETGMRAICAQDVNLVSYSVLLIAPQSSDKWDRLSFSEFVRSPGVQNSVHATFAAGLSEGAYAAQGWELLNALYAPNLPFTLVAYSADHVLFSQNWVIGKPRNATQQMILDHIKSNRDDTPTPIYHSMISSGPMGETHAPSRLPTSR